MLMIFLQPFVNVSLLYSLKMLNDLKVVRHFCCSFREVVVPLRTGNFQHRKTHT